MAPKVATTINLESNAIVATTVAGEEVWRTSEVNISGNELEQALKAAVDDAKKNLFQVPRHHSTITHEIVGRSDAARVMLRPASPGTGVIAGGGVRAVLELAGIRDILAKTVEDKLPHAQKLSDPFAAGSKISDLETPTPIGTASAKSPPEALA